MENNNLSVFEGKRIRRIYDEKKEKWYFSVIDIIGVLTEQDDYKKAQSYWTTLKNRLKNEGSEFVTNCDKLKLMASDGKKYFTDVADVETILRLIQSVQSQNLRDHMTEAELIFTSLAELSTRQIAESMKVRGLEQNKIPAKKG